MFRSDTLSLASPTQSAGEPAPDAGFTAQLLAQPGRRRGLREGAAALDRARSAYLRAEWSGEHDRRPGSGLLRRDRL